MNSPLTSVAHEPRQATQAAADDRPGPRLVISVKNRAEALDAVQAGAHVIDVKDPSRGALGRADAHVVAEVAGALQRQVPVSAALGEIVTWSSRDDALQRWFSMARGTTLAKFGTAGLRRIRQWHEPWKHLLAHCPNDVRPVAVVYADWRSAQAPRPDRVIDAASDMGCGLVLIDTYDKNHGDLFTVWPRRELAGAIARIRHRGMGVVLGGSIALDSLVTAVGLQPDYIAVRGAVCVGSRRAEVSGERVGQFAARLERLVRGPARIGDHHPGTGEFGGS